VAEKQLGYEAKRERSGKSRHENPLDDRVRDGVMMRVRALRPMLAAIFGMVADDSGHGEMPPTSTQHRLLGSPEIVSIGVQRQCRQDTERFERVLC
jgi:hypothetical protein